MIKFWLISQAVFIAMVIYISLVDHVKWERDSILAALIMLMFGPLALLAVFCVFLYDVSDNRTRLKCRRIVTEWEGRAKAKGHRGTFDWYLDKTYQEERYTLLRDNIRSMSSKDLKTLAQVRKETFDIEQPLRDAIVDELLERKILSSE